MKAFELKILAADKPFFSGQCESVVVPTPDGEYGILADHRNLIAAVSPGMMMYRPVGDKNRYASVADGLVKVEKGKVLVLVDTAEHPEEIDVMRAQRELDVAKEELLQKQSIAEYQANLARLARAVSRLKAKNYRTGD